MHKYQTKIMQQLAGGLRVVHVRYGAGKGLAAIKWAEQIDHSRVVDVGIICPNHLTSTWEGQIKEWGGSNTDCNQWPVTPAAAKNWGYGVRFFIIPVTKLRSAFSDVQTYYRHLDAVILDESTCIKNSQTQVAQAAHRLAVGVWRDIPRITMSGNPSPEGAYELWSQFQFAYGAANPLGVSYYVFLKRWFLKVDYGYVLEHSTQERFRSIVQQYSITFDEDDYEEFMAAMRVRPEYETVIVNPGPDQQKLLRKLDKEWSLNGTDFNWTMQVEQKKAQIASGFFYEDGTDEDASKHAIYLGDQPKQRALKEMIEELYGEGHRRLAVWHSYRAEYVPILQAMPDWATVLVFERELNKLTRNMMWKDFNDPDPDRLVVAVVPCSMAQGINDLKQCPVGIIYSNAWSQETRNQLEARHARLGSQHQIVKYYDLVCMGCKDKEIVEALIAKNLTPARLKTIVSTPAREGAAK